MATRVLTFPNDIKLGKNIIKAHVEFGDPELVVDEIRRQAGKLGYRAWSIAASLRKIFGIPKFDSEPEFYNFVDILKKSSSI